MEMQATLNDYKCWEWPPRAQEAYGSALQNPSPYQMGKTHKHTLLGTGWGTQRNLIRYGTDVNIPQVSAVLERQAQFKVCPYCHEEFPPEHMAEGACHGCAEKHLEIVF